MNPLCVAASIAAQVAYIIGARRTTRNRRNRAIPVGSFNLHHNSDLIRRARGVHGPEAQRAAERELNDLRMWAQQMGTTP